MIGIIDVGGGLRGVYGAGVFDRCLDEKIEFDCCIGVSAGSANIVSFLGKQRGRNYRFYCDYAFHKEYMSFSNLLRTGSYIGLDYIYGTLSVEGGRDPLNYDGIADYGGILKIVATDAETAEPHYFGAEDVHRNNYRVLSASSCIPVVCRSIKIDGRSYYDGGVSDPVPLKKAFELGCDKVVIILTKPRDFTKDSRTDSKGAALIRRTNPLLADAVCRRAEIYNKSVELAKELEKEEKCLIVAPDDCCGVNTLTKNKSNLDALYKKGYRDGEKILEFVKNK